MVQVGDNELYKLILRENKYTKSIVIALGRRILSVTLQLQLGLITNIFRFRLISYSRIPLNRLLRKKVGKQLFESKEIFEFIGIFELSALIFEYQRDYIY